MSNLIVLDLNGVLVTRYGNVKVRPGAKNFIERLMKKYTVCIWSSMRPSNINRAVKRVMESSEFEGIIIMSQDDCEAVPRKNKHPLFMKNITKIHEKFPNRFEKILFIDDSGEKVQNNPKDTYFIVDTWNPEKGIPHASLTLREIEMVIDKKMS